MSRVIAVGTAEPLHTFKQSEIRDFACTHYLNKGTEIGKMLRVFDNAWINTRHFVNTPDWFDTPKRLKARSESFVQHALSLSKSAINSCLESYGGDYGEFEHIIFVSSTGVAAPTIDALLINDLKLDPHMKRTPVWGLGCVGGAVALSRALEYTKAYPKSAVMIVAVEICSLAFHSDDLSMSNLVALSLFSDGAAACMIAGEQNPLYQQGRVNLISSLSTTYHDSLDVMGWEVIDDGFKAIFSKDIPKIVRQNVKSNVWELLKRHQLRLENVNHYIAHPGGPKVIISYEESLGLSEGALSHSRSVLGKHGNMSSPTVLYVLKEFMEENKYDLNEYGMISALGPGFSSELLLFKTA